VLGCFMQGNGAFVVGVGVVQRTWDSVTVSAVVSLVWMGAKAALVSSPSLTVSVRPNIHRNGFVTIAHVTTETPITPPAAPADTEYSVRNAKTVSINLLPQNYLEPVLLGNRRCEVIRVAPEPGVGAKPPPVGWVGGRPAVPPDVSFWGGLILL